MVKYTKEDLEILLNHMPFSAWIKDVNNRYVYVNDVYAHTVGDKPENVLGKLDSDYWPEEVCCSCQAADIEVRKTKMPKIFEEVRGEGVHKRWYETYKEAIFDEDGAYKYVIGISREISLSKSLNQKLNESNYELTTLEEEKSSRVTIKERMQLIEVDIFRWLDASETSIWIYDASKNRLEICTENGRTQEYLKISDYLEINRGALKLDEMQFFVEGILPIEERAQYIDIEVARANDIAYVGVYKIENEGELLGVLTCSFKSDKKFKVNQDDSVRKICNKLSGLIKIEKYKDTQAELNLFLETVVDLIAIVSEEGKFKKITPAWSELLGWQQSELLKMNWDKLIAPEDLNDTVEAIYKNEGTGPIRAYRSRFLCKGGQYKWLEWNSRWLKENGVVLIAARDVTKQVQMEHKSYELQRVLHLETVKNEFFANISHEFRTPINIILGSIQLLEGKVVDLEQKYEEKINFMKYGKTMKQNAYRLLRLVNNLIDMTKIDTGHYTLSLQNLNIVNVVEEITLSVAQYINGKGIELLFDTEIEEEILACDPDKIERIMLNLLSNAIKYTPEGGMVKVYLYKGEHHVVVTVEDNGIGISEEKQEVIFERFVQADDILTRQTEGSGIGLSLVKSLVEMHGGSIQVHSTVGKGTKFIFTMPIQQLPGDYIVNNYSSGGRIEKCSLEFSDVYW